MTIRLKISLVATVALCIVARAVQMLTQAAYYKGAANADTLFVWATACTITATACGMWAFFELYSLLRRGR